MAQTAGGSGRRLLPTAANGSIDVRCGPSQRGITSIEGDVRDLAQLAAIMSQHAPEIVIISRRRPW